MSNRQVNTADHKAEIGEAGNNHMANQNGLDEIDLWAMGIGNAERSKSTMTPRKRHTYSTM